MSMQIDPKRESPVRISKAHLSEMKLLKIAYSCRSLDDVIEKMLVHCRIDKVKALITNPRTDTDIDAVTDKKE